MIETRLGSRYAKSVLDLSKEKGRLEEVKNDFDLIREVLKQNPDFRLLLKSPVVKGDKKRRIIEEIFRSKLSEITKSLVDIMIRKGREPYLIDIAIAFRDLYDKEMKITRGVLTSAAPLTDEQKAKLRKEVEESFGTTFILEEKIDPELIGGFVLHIGDKLFDGSIAGKLKDLKQEFKRNPYIKTS